MGNAGGKKVEVGVERSVGGGGEERREDNEGRTMAKEEKEQVGEKEKRGSHRSGGEGRVAILATTKQ